MREREKVEAVCTTGQKTKAKIQSTPRAVVFLRRMINTLKFWRVTEMYAAATVALQIP